MTTASESKTLETVSIKIPASPEYLQVVRLVAAGLAARISFTLEDIEDLKIAVDELSAYVTGRTVATELCMSISRSTAIASLSGGPVSSPSPMRSERT